MRRRVILALLALPAGLCGYGLLFAGVAASVHYPLAGTSAPAHRGIRGAYHLHSTRSDGRATPEAIAAAAAAAGLDFVVLTDHNVASLDPPKYHEGVLIISGQELSTPQGHLVALGTSRALTAAERERGALATVLALGGQAVPAHPYQKKRPWTDWAAAKGAAGIELYSADSMFRTAWASPWSLFIPAVFAYPVNAIQGLETIVQPQGEANDQLLALSRDGAKVALCAHDAHGYPGYESEFRALSMYLPSGGADAVASLPADPRAAEGQVTRALLGGFSYCAFHGLAEGSGFALEGLGPHRTMRAGEVVRVLLPQPAPPELQLRVAGAGHAVDANTVMADGSGALQVEVWAKLPRAWAGGAWKPWLVSSPVQVW